MGMIVVPIGPVMLPNKAVVYRLEIEDGTSVREMLCWYLCLDRKVHLVHRKGWEYHPGRIADAYNLESWENLNPCDGSCVEYIEIPEEICAILQRFIESSGSDAQEIIRKTPMCS